MNSKETAPTANRGFNEAALREGRRYGQPAGLAKEPIRFNEAALREGRRFVIEASLGRTGTWLQ